MYFKETTPFILAAILFCFSGIAFLNTGCASSSRSVDYNGPVFSEGEIRSKTWADSHGRHLELLNFDVIHLKGKDDLYVAKYGTKEDGFVFCIELYRPVRNLGKKNSFMLFEHDYESGKVVTFNVQEDSNDTVIEITREIPPGMGSPYRQKNYALSYGNDYIVRPDLEEIFSK